MTTDDQTPGPTPAFPSAARLAEIRERDAATPDAFASSAEEHRLARADRRALLAHIDALTPPAAADGEALGRGLYLRHHAGNAESIWPQLAYQEQRRWITAALALHATGYAAGAVAMTGEGDDPGTEGAVLILMKRHDAELHAAHAAGRSEGEAERARLVEERDGLAAQARGATSRMMEIDGELATIRRLHDLATANREAYRAEACAVIDRLGAEVAKRDEEIARLTAELAEARATLAESEAHAGGMLTLCNVRTAERDAARRDGAREERRLCFDDMRGEQLAAPDKSYVDRVFARIEARPLLRARGEGQGS